VEAVLRKMVEVDARTEILSPIVKITDTSKESSRDTADPIDVGKARCSGGCLVCSSLSSPSAEQHYARIAVLSSHRLNSPIVIGQTAIFYTPTNRSRSLHERPIPKKLTHAQGQRPPAQNLFRAVPSVSVRSDVVPSGSAIAPQIQMRLRFTPAIFLDVC
jgi:hypothetical protein